MKITLSILFILSTAISANGQFLQNLKEKDKAFHFDNYPTKKIILDSISDFYKKPTVSNIDSVVVIDSRYSNKSLGFITALMKKVKPGISGSTTKPASSLYYHDYSINNIQFENLPEKSIAGYISSALASSTNETKFSLLVIIKNLWLSDKIDFIGKKNYENEEEYFSKSGIIGNFEFYIYKDNSYWPIFRYERKLRNNFALKEYAKKYILSFIDSCLIKLSTINLQNISQSKKALTLEQIKQYNNERFEIPVLKDSLYKRGVYMNFNEFKNNTPHFADFNIEKNRLADIMTVKGADGKETIERNAWGYCDGKKFYIQNNSNYFELSRIDNSFFVKVATNKLRTNELGSNSITNVGTGLIIPPLKIKYNAIKSDSSPYCLNMDTGEIY